MTIQMTIHSQMTIEFSIYIQLNIYTMAEVNFKCIFK